MGGLLNQEQPVRCRSGSRMQIYPKKCLFCQTHDKNKNTVESIPCIFSSFNLVFNEFFLNFSFVLINESAVLYIRISTDPHFWRPFGSGSERSTAAEEEPGSKSALYRLCLCMCRALIVHVSLFGQDPASDPDLDADFPSLDVSIHIH